MANRFEVVTPAGTVAVSRDVHEAVSAFVHFAERLAEPVTLLFEGEPVASVRS